MVATMHLNTGTYQFNMGEMTISGPPECMTCNRLMYIGMWASMNMVSGWLERYLICTASFVR
jgi:hypothetical protein